MPVNTLTQAVRRRGYTNPDDMFEHCIKPHRLPPSKELRPIPVSISPSNLGDETKPLYQDKFLSIYADSIVIKKYFFPIIAPKHILVEEVVRIDSTSSLHLDALDYNIWGLSDVSNSIWWALDLKRETFFREKYPYVGLIFTVKNDSIRKGVSVERPEKAFPILQFLFESRAKCNF